MLNSTMWGASKRAGRMCDAPVKENAACCSHFAVPAAIDMPMPSNDAAFAGDAGVDCAWAAPSWGVMPSALLALAADTELAPVLPERWRDARVLRMTEVEGCTGAGARESSASAPVPAV
ncbi:MAG: hypothetical protein EOO65_03665 [Methanosarcinales archaeon]|nr:MAG: hypothetical protein EOO65_03665 [Methanosarcinales archaeon]